MPDARRRTHASAGSGSGRGRDAHVDALRGFALVLGLIGLCTPSRHGVVVTRGMFDIVALGRSAPLPLFALLIGVGAQLGDRGARGAVAVFVRGGMRAGVLAALGWWMVGWHAPVSIAFLPLAAAVLLAPLLARASTTALWAIGATLWAAAPVLRSQFAARASQAHTAGDEVGARLWQALFVGPDARATTLLVFVCLGIIVWRERDRGPSGAVLGAAAMGTGLLFGWAAYDGRLTLGAASASHVDVFVEVLLVGGAAAMWFALTAERDVPVLWASNAGSMTLSLSVLQIAVLDWLVRDLLPGTPPDSGVVVMTLAVITVVTPVLWRRQVRVHPWSRGPIEGPTAMVTGLFR